MIFRLNKPKGIQKQTKAFLRYFNFFKNIVLYIYISIYCFGLFQDVKWLIKQLPNVKRVKYIDKIPFGHLSFSLSPIMKEVVNSQIANELLNNTL